MAPLSADEAYTAGQVDVQSAIKATERFAAAHALGDADIFSYMREQMRLRRTARIQVGELPSVHEEVRQ